MKFQSWFEKKESWDENIYRRYVGYLRNNNDSAIAQPMKMTAPG